MVYSMKQWFFVCGNLISEGEMRRWQEMKTERQTTKVNRYLQKKQHLPHPLLINVVATPVFPDRPVLPILWTVK